MATFNDHPEAPAKGGGNWNYLMVAAFLALLALLSNADFRTQDAKSTHDEVTQSQS
jgi:hypothetical protein